MSNRFNRAARGHLLHLCSAKSVRAEATVRAQAESQTRVVTVHPAGWPNRRATKRERLPQFMLGPKRGHRS